MKKVAVFLKKYKIVSVLVTIVSVFLWLVIWEIGARRLDLTFIFPGAIETIKTLFKLALTAGFWKTILFSMLRIIFGLILGTVLGVAFAIAYQFVPYLRSFIGVGMSVIKSTPVASIIMLLWVIIESRTLPITIALLMVMPIIWQNVCDGFSAIDRNLSEVCDVFEFSRKKRMRLLILPTLLKYFVPAFLTSIGLAWKSGIAAEIISYTKNSIGRYISDSKAFLEGEIMLAWTLAVVLLSLCFEYLVKSLLRRWNE